MSIETQQLLKKAISEINPDNLSRLAAIIIGLKLKTYNVRVRCKVSNKSLEIGLLADPPIQIEKDMLISIIVTELANLNLNFFAKINIYYMGKGQRWVKNLYLCNEVKENTEPEVGENNAQIVSRQDELDEEKTRNERLVKENDILRKEIADMSEKEKLLNEICSLKDNQINELSNKLQQQSIALEELSSSQTKLDRLRAWFEALIKRESKIFNTGFDVDHISDYVVYMPRIVEFLISEVKKLEEYQVKASVSTSKVKELESKVKELEEKLHLLMKLMKKPKKISTWSSLV